MKISSKKKKRKKGRLRKKEARTFIVEPLPPHLYKAGGLSFQNFQKIGGCLIFPIKREGLVKRRGRGRVSLIFILTSLSSTIFL